MGMTIQYNIKSIRVVDKFVNAIWIGWIIFTKMCQTNDEIRIFSFCLVNGSLYGCVQIILMERINVITICILELIRRRSREGIWCCNTNICDLCTTVILDDIWCKGICTVLFLKVCGSDRCTQCICELFQSCKLVIEFMISKSNSIIADKIHQLDNIAAFGK